MRQTLFSFASALIAVTLLTTTALAASDEDRIEEMERNLEALQRAVYSGSAGKVGSGGGGANTQVQFSAMEERLRAIEGRFEEVEFQNRQLKEQVERMQKDTDMRFSDMQQQQMNAAPAAAAGAAIAPATAPVTIPAATTPNDPQMLSAPAAGAPTLTTPREMYDYAFNLLNQTQYEAAGQAFSNFIKTYPKDPLVSNAYYWLGETYYVRQKFPDATDNFRLGFESAPAGPKAGDNLLKLGMSLNAQNRKQEACVVLKQVLNKYATNSVNLKVKTEMEQKRAGCI